MSLRNYVMILGSQKRKRKNRSLLFFFSFFSSWPNGAIHPFNVLATLRSMKSNLNIIVIIFSFFLFFYQQGKTDGADTSTSDSESSRSHSGSSAGQSRDVKKHMRMIRNRQSAALSRKRKADRIDSLVQRVVDLEAVIFFLLYVGL
jgi:hypothetical protein